MIEFTDELVNKLKNNLPEKIVNLGIEFDINGRGFLRFDENVISNVYIRVIIPNCESGLLKFKNENGKFIFQFIYIGFSKIPVIKDEYYEFRYNSNLEFDSVYVYNKNWLKGCKKGNEKYQFNDNEKDFKKEIKLAVDNNIIKNNINNTYYPYLSRNGKNSIYIKVGGIINDK